MASLHRHLQLGQAEHDSLGYRPDCPRCRARLLGRYPEARPLSRRGEAAATAGILTAGALLSGSTAAAGQPPADAPPRSAPPAVVTDANAAQSTPERAAPPEERPGEEGPRVAEQPGPPRDSPLAAHQEPAAGTGSGEDPVPEVPEAPPAPAESSQQASRDPTHTVRDGESLWLIAERRLGAGASDAAVAGEVERLWALNADAIGTGSPNLIHPGQELRV